MKAKRPALSRQGGHVSFPVALSYLLLQEDFAAPLSQASSAVSSASFPSARSLWHLKMHEAALPRALPTQSSHFATSLLGGMNPVSSPPKGVAAIAIPTASSAANPVPIASF